MRWTDFESAFSAARVGRYKARCRGSEAHAIAAYRHNLLLSEALTPFLCTVEIALRNAVHGQLARHYGRPDWWEAWQGDRRFKHQLNEIGTARNKLQRRKEAQVPDKIVAELTFGFWSTLFNAEFQAELWQPLRRAFPHCPKTRRQRGTISSVVNKLRMLRNRAFHHEPVLWIQGDAGLIHRDGLELLAWMHGSLGPWFGRIDRVPHVWAGWKALEAEMLKPARPVMQA